MNVMNELTFLAASLTITGAIIATSVIVAVITRNIAIGFCVAIAVTILGAALGGADKIPIFWDVPSVLLVVFTVTILVGGQRKWTLFLQGLKTTLSASAPNIPDAAETAALFRYLANGTLWGSGLWMLTGLIMMFSDFDPDRIYLGIAVSVLPLFYSLMLSVFLFNPIAYRFEQVADKK
jgi:flagellar motor component MotA